MTNPRGNPNFQKGRRGRIATLPPPPRDLSFPSHVDQFFEYCKYYAYNKAREKPLAERTLARYRRGMTLVTKLLGHDVEYVTEIDQIIFMQKILEYRQGTRRVSTQIFQRYIAWCIRHEIITTQNLIVKKEEAIIGADTAVSYKYINAESVRKFFGRLKTEKLIVMLGIVYYGGLIAEEISGIKKSHVQAKGIIVYRSVRKEAQLVPLPDHLMRSVRKYAEHVNLNDDDVLFGLKRIENSWSVAGLYKTATIEADYLIGTTFKDFRTSGIRHFYELTEDLELTKIFAGVANNKSGWLQSLLDDETHHITKTTKVRKYYGQQKKRLEPHRDTKAK